LISNPSPYLHVVTSSHCVFVPHPNLGNRSAQTRQEITDTAASSGRSRHRVSTTCTREGRLTGPLKFRYLPWVPSRASCPSVNRLEMQVVWMHCLEGGELGRLTLADALALALDKTLAQPHTFSWQPNHGTPSHPSFTSRTVAKLPVYLIGQVEMRGRQAGRQLCLT